MYLFQILLKKVSDKLQKLVSFVLLPHPVSSPCPSRLTSPEGGGHHQEREKIVSFFPSRFFDWPIKLT